MRYLLLGVFLLTGFVSNAHDTSDTVTFWTISYDKTVIVNGNIALTQSPRYELTVKETSLKNLTVSLVYDAGQPAISSLAVKEKNEVLRTIAHDPDMGAYFVVPVKELIGTLLPNQRHELDFYYTDDRGQKNLKLATIIFILKQ